MNDDVRSPGSGSTPGPLSQQPPHGLDTDPGKHFNQFFFQRVSKMHTKKNESQIGLKKQFANY